MRTWNFRVVKTADELAIHYAYYNDERTLAALSIDPVSPACEDVEGLRETLRLMLDACEDTVVEYGTLRPLIPRYSRRTIRISDSRSGVRPAIWIGLCILGKRHKYFRRVDMVPNLMTKRL